MRRAVGGEGSARRRAPREKPSEVRPVCQSEPGPHRLTVARLTVAWLTVARMWHGALGAVTDYKGPGAGNTG